MRKIKLKSLGFSNYSVLFFWFINVLWWSLGLSQLGAASFFPIYFNSVIQVFFIIILLNVYLFFRLEKSVPQNNVLFTQTINQKIPVLLEFLSNDYDDVSVEVLEFAKDYIHVSIVIHFYFKLLKLLQLYNFFQCREHNRILIH